MSDNGPQFVSNEMKIVSDTYGFTLLMSSLHYLQINGLAGCTIHTIKELLQDSPDPYLALLSFVLLFQPSRTSDGETIKNTHSNP